MTTETTIIVGATNRLRGVRGTTNATGIPQNSGPQIKRMQIPLERGRH
jgi:hypothetical protein